MEYGTFAANITGIVRAEMKVLISQPLPDDVECADCRDRRWVDVTKNGREIYIPCSCRPHNTAYPRMTASSRKATTDDAP